MRWYFPSWSGDFRLVPDGKRSRLELVALTPGEVTALESFFTAAYARGWIDAALPLGAGDTKSVTLSASVGDAGVLLLEHVKPHDRTLTALSFGSGVEAVAEAADKQATSELVAEGEKKKRARAASVGRPTPSCPDCVPGSVAPASEVLLSFLTPEQHRTWARDRVIAVDGHLSGHRYYLAHRHSALAQKWTRICYDADDDIELKFHDWSVPPEEEVLAAKLVLEHREPWLRNEATAIFGDYTDVYKNPFGDHLDGVRDAAFTSTVGWMLGGAAAALGMGPALP